MHLADLIRDLPITAKRGDDINVEIKGVTEDSRRVRPGWLFVARPGTSHNGSTFVQSAIERGAAAIVSQQPVSAPVPTLACEDAATAVAMLAERWVGSPSRALKLMGVTGTNGKTTVAWLVRQILNHAGARCGLIGTIEIDEGVGGSPATLTTPAAEDISASLSRMATNGCTAAAIEASSHALEQGRTAALEFDVAVFTNLSGDHLDYHGSMEAYAAAKARLFEALRPTAFALVNSDDPASERMLRDCSAGVIRCSMSEGADAYVHVEASGLLSEATMNGPWGELQARLALVGHHNAMNALQAVAVAFQFGVAAEAIAEALPSLSAPPGRLERVSAEGVSGPRVLVDYAHTDDALEKALTAVAGRTGDGKLWAVFGCGGDRDQTKRPRMGAVAGRLADRVVVTSDNPRSEDPQSIVDEVLKGVPRSVWTASDPDREAAIRLAITQAEENDVIVIAGKGHEDYQIIGDGSGGTLRRDFDDRLIARDALRDRLGVTGGAF